MIKLTKVATMVLFESLQASGVHPGAGLRVKQEAGEFKLQLDVPHDNDRVIRYNEVILLIVDRQVEEEIGNAVIDIEDGVEDPQLVLLTRLRKGPPPAWAAREEWQPLRVPRYVSAN